MTSNEIRILATIKSRLIWFDWNFYVRAPINLHSWERVELNPFLHLPFLTAFWFPSRIVTTYLSPVSCCGQFAGHVPVQGMPDVAWLLMLLHKYLGAVLPASVVIFTFSKLKFEHGLEAEQWMALAILYRLVPVTLIHRTSEMGRREVSQPWPV